MKRIFDALTAMTASFECPRNYARPPTPRDLHRAWPLRRLTERRTHGRTGGRKERRKERRSNERPPERRETGERTNGQAGKGEWPSVGTLGHEICGRRARSSVQQHAALGARAEKPKANVPSAPAHESQGKRHISASLQKANDAQTHATA